MREAHPVKFPVLIALSVLLAGCTDNPLLPELNGRWAPLKGVTTRLVLASNNSSVPITPPNLSDLCRSEYVTFQKFNASRDFAGAVFLHRNDRREPTPMIAEVKRQGDRITLIGREPFNPLVGTGPARLELILRNGELAFDDIIDPRGRSVRYDRIKSPDPIRTYRAGINTIGDIYRMLFDLKRCTA
jgi:hypothetical protein